MAETNASAIQSAIEGMPLPARRDEIVEYAEVEGAEDDLLAALRALPDREYENAEEVSEALRPAQPYPLADESE
jgi:hypothetical protein